MELHFPFSLITSLILLFLFLFKLLEELKRSKTNNATQKLPPSPWKLPLIGNMLHLAGSLPHQALKNLARKHGPLMHLQLGEISAIVVSSPKMAKEVLKTHDLAFANRPDLLAASIIANNNSFSFSPYGEYWRQMRKICTLELLSAKKVQSFRSIRESEVLSIIESIQSSSTKSPINLTKMIFTSINAIVCRASFGRRCKEEDALIKLSQEVISLAGGFDVADLFPSLKFLHVICGMRPKLEKLQKKIDKILENIINEREKNLSSMEMGSNGESKVEDLLDVLLRLKESGGLEFPITSNNIKAIIFEMFSAGTDTSSTTIEWAISELIRNPRVMEKAQAELRCALNGKKTINEADIQGLTYLKLVIKETLRLHPPLPLILPRECREQREIGGYTIPIKTKVIVNTWAIGRDPEYWHNAENFEPERFEESNVDFTGNSLEYIPFGAGRRMCPGIAFGLANVEIFLAQLLYHFDWKLPIRMKPKDLDMGETFGATVKRKNDLYLIAEPYAT
ncbi:hypothetical protein LguiB_006062 [Lonicera macranthoides]